MDPNATLNEMRRLARLLLHEELEGLSSFANDVLALADAAEALAEAVEALDGWLTKGGFLPHAWASRPQRSGPIAQERDEVVQEIEDTACELAAALEEYFSVDPDMLSFKSTLDRVERALDRAKALGLMPVEED